MTGYKLTPQQKNTLMGKEWCSGCKFNPIQDKDGVWFIFDEEYQAALEILGVSSLPSGDYVAPIVQSTNLKK